MKQLGIGLVCLASLIVAFGIITPLSFGSRSQTAKSLVLLYNHIVTSNASYNTFAERYAHVTTHQFENQLTMLQKRGYVFYTYDALITKKNLPRQSAIIIFRDTYKDIATNALPILVKKHIPFTIFVQSIRENDPNYLLPNELNTLQQQGALVMPADKDLLINRSTRIEVSGVITNTQFSDILPEVYHHEWYWAVLVGLLVLGIGLFSLYRPWYALLIPIVFLPSYLFRFFIFGIPATLLEIVLLISLTGTVVYHAKVVVRYFRTHAFLYQIVLFLLAALISTIFADNKIYAFGGLKALVIEPIIFSLIVSFWLAQQRLRLQHVTIALVISCTVIAAYSLIQYVRGDTYIDYTLEKLTTFFGNPNYLASFLTPGLMFCLTYLAFAKSKIGRLLVLGCLAIIGSSFYLAQSDSALLGFMAAAGLLTLVRIIKNDRWKTIVMSAWIFIIVIGGAGIFAFVARSASYGFLEQHHLNSLISRQYIYQTTATMIRQHPLTGVGLLNFQHIFVKTVPLNIYEVDIALAHNTLLDFWVQMGILGIIAYIWLLVRFFRIVVTHKSVFSYALATAMLVLVIHGMLDSQYHKNDYSIIFWLLIAMATYIETNILHTYKQENIVQ